MSVKSFLLRIYDKAFQVKDALYDFLTRKKVIVSIGDMMSYRGLEDGIQLLVASRLMDVEAYLFKHDNSFQYQKMMSTCGRNDDFYYDDKIASQVFEDLISSYMEKGYNGKSHFLLDKDYLLRNGTHRAALHIYLKDYTAKAYVLRRKFSAYDNIYTHFEDNLPKEVFDLIKLKLNNIREEFIENGMSFCAVIQKDHTLTDILANKYVNIKKSFSLKDDFYIGFPALDNKFVPIIGQAYQLVLFTLEQPEYEIASGHLESAKIRSVKYSSDTFVSPSCYIGKIVYDSLKPYCV